MEELKNRVQKTCPFCDEFISVKAEICKHCLKEQIPRSKLIVERDEYYVLSWVGWIPFAMGVIISYSCFLNGFAYKWSDNDFTIFYQAIILYILFWTVQTILSKYPKFDFRERNIPKLFDEIKRFKRAYNQSLFAGFLIPFTLIIVLHFTAPKLSDFDIYLKNNTTYSQSQIIQQKNYHLISAHALDTNKGVIIYWGILGKFIQVGVPQSNIDFDGFH